MAAATPHRIGLPPQHQHAEHQADRHGDDLAGPPAGQRAATLAWAEAVARPVVAAHPVPPWSGGHAAGSHLMHGPWPSSPM